MTTRQRLIKRLGSYYLIKGYNALFFLGLTGYLIRKMAGSIRSYSATVCC
jgi:hypothetical protein